MRGNATVAVRDVPVVDVPVVIVTYNSAAVLADCLASLPAGRVVVADNASADDTVAVARAHPVDVVHIGRNAGYAAAVNAAVAGVPDADAVLVLNPDCRLRPGALDALIRAFDDPRCGIAVPKLVNPDGSLQPSLRRAPTLRRAVAQALLGGTRAGRTGKLGELITDPAAYTAPHEAVWATGAAMLLRADMVAEIGPWDETFLLYGEETEYAMRARDAGWRLHYTPDSVVEHIGGESNTSPSLYALLTVNRVRLYRRSVHRFAGAAYFGAVLLGELIRAGAGRRTARAAVVALLRPSRRPRALPGG